MRAWKMIDADHADSFETGCLKIGTLEGYKNLENGRADALDGKVKIAIDTLLPVVSDSDSDSDALRARERLRALNLFVGANVHMSNCEVILSTPTVYTLCLSVPGTRYDPDPTIEKRVFRLRNLGRIARRIVDVHADLESYFISRVIYERRIFNIHEAQDGQPDPFIKDPIFSPEREIRIVFFPKEGVECITFVTKPDPHIADLISAVGDADLD